MPYTGSVGNQQLAYQRTGTVMTEANNLDLATRLQRHLDLLELALAGSAESGTVLNQFEVSAGAGLSISVAAGSGLVAGLLIKSAVATAKAALPDNQANVYIYLKTTATTGADASFTVEYNTTGVVPADSILIAKVTTAAGAVTAIENSPTNRTPRIPYGYSGTGIPTLRVVAPAGAQYTSPKTAIEACSAGDTVLITPGTYTVSSAITVPQNNVTILGTNRDACVIYWDNADANHCILLGAHTGCVIQDLTLSAIAGKTGRAITGTTCSYARIQNVYITSPNLSRMISIGTATRVRILGCRLSGGASYAGIVMGGTDALIADNLLDISDTGEVYAIYVGASAHRTTVSRNNVTMSGAAPTRAVHIVDSDYVTAEDNIIRITTPGAGIWINLFADTRTCTANSVYNNLVLSAGNVGTGINLSTTSPRNYNDNQVCDNAIHGCALAIGLADIRVRYTLVHDNLVRDNAAGLSDAGTSTHSADNA